MIICFCIYSPQFTIVCSALDLSLSEMGILYSVLNECGPWAVGIRLIVMLLCNKRFSLYFRFVWFVLLVFIVFVFFSNARHIRTGRLDLVQTQRALLDKSKEWIIRNSPDERRAHTNVKLHMKIPTEWNWMMDSRHSDQPPTTIITVFKINKYKWWGAKKRVVFRFRYIFSWASNFVWFFFLFLSLSFVIFLDWLIAYPVCFNQISPELTDFHFALNSFSFSSRSSVLCVCESVFQSYISQCLTRSIAQLIAVCVSIWDRIQ